MPSTRRKLCSIGDPVRIRTESPGIRACRCSQMASIRRMLPSPKVSCEYTSILTGRTSSGCPFSPLGLEEVLSPAAWDSVTDADRQSIPVRDTFLPFILGQWHSGNRHTTSLPLFGGPKMGRLRFEDAAESAKEVRQGTRFISLPKPLLACQNRYQLAKILSSRLNSVNNFFSKAVRSSSGKSIV